jgi:hypothetical protein
MSTPAAQKEAKLLKIEIHPNFLKDDISSKINIENSNFLNQINKYKPKIVN